MRWTSRWIFSLFVLSAACTTLQSQEKTFRTENVIVITLDGFRWQEFFGGADEGLLNAKDGGVKDLPGLKKRFWRETAPERREILLPFFWKAIATRGQIFGDRTRKAPAKLTNGLKFSYPGYSEMFCGFPDPTINS